MAITAAAGPASNILLATASLCISKILMFIGFATNFNSVVMTFYTIFYTMTAINISLAIFNLLPFPPFDGSRIFNYFLSDKYYFKIMEYEQQIFIGLFLLLCLGVFDAPLNFLSSIVLALLNKLTFFVDIIINFVLNIIL